MFARIAACSAPGKPTASQRSAYLDDTVAYVVQLARGATDAEQARRGRALFNGRAGGHDF